MGALPPNPCRSPPRGDRGSVVRWETSVHTRVKVPSAELASHDRLELSHERHSAVGRII
jgi:hypothetical protein